MRVASLVLGIFGLLLSFIPFLFYPAIGLAVVGLALGVAAIISAKKTQAPKGMATAGVVLSTIAMLVGGTVFYLTMRAVNAVKEAFNTAVPNALEKLEKAAKAPPGPASAFKIEKLSLQADLPAGATVLDGIGGKGVMISAPGVVLNIDPPSRWDAKTIKQGQKEAKLFNGKNVKAETLTDGWAVTFENTGSLGTNYWVTVRRSIAGKAYKCSTTTSTAQQQDAAVAACKSLRPIDSLASR